MCWTSWNNTACANMLGTNQLKIRERKTMIAMASSILDGTDGAASMFHSPLFPRFVRAANTRRRQSNCERTVEQRKFVWHWQAKNQPRAQRERRVCSTRPIFVNMADIPVCLTLLTFAPASTSTAWENSEKVLGKILEHNVVNSCAVSTVWSKKLDKIVCCLL